jgi:hypothetical protein
MVVAYYKPQTGDATAWYMIPSLGPNGAFITTNSWYQSSTNPSTYTMNVGLYKPNTTVYNSAVTFTEFRIFVTKATTIVSGGRVRNLTLSGIDLNDHDALCRYLGVPTEQREHRLKF